MADYILKKIDDEVYARVRSKLALERRTLRDFLLACLEKKSKEEKE